ncbi:hypothetical protein LTR09_009067 [Extremus antarcticus]|uniref:D-isomer specific 2-hydroxyacid dehydrogenase NAD-binding domain-containing protein n=1 Tax=Extremus antarcticus TaxID=702011 RepID=A0AAJ0DGC4_9PEZI|nr:hypothetical protein LTR09_009067 [Extremus antarcticus]
MASHREISVAILDDYPGIAPKHFARLPGIKIDSFPDTLHAATESGIAALANRLEPYQVISTMRERTAFPALLLQQLPNLKLLMTTGARNASISLEAASSHHVIVTGTTGTNSPSHEENYSISDLPPPAAAGSVNQHAWALLLSLCSRIPRDDAALRSEPGAWQSGLAIPLGGKTIGVVGLGKLGTQMARTAALAFGMSVIAWSENLTQAKVDAAAEGAGFAKGAWRAVGKEELFREADVVSVHLVLSERSQGIVGARELGWMKPSALLVNTSRGGLVDEEALLEVVRGGGIRGVALDVFWEEPLPEDSVWRRREGFKSEVVLSPHMGYANAGTMNRWYEEQAENLERWMKGAELVCRIN